MHKHRNFIIALTVSMAMMLALVGVAGASNVAPQGRANQRATENVPDHAPANLPFLEFVVTQNSSQNDYNRDNGWPHINWEIDGLEITFEFVNPTPHAFVFDYRIDGEDGEEHAWSGIVIGEGELEGEEIGLWYNPVTVIDGTHEVTVTAEEEVWVGMRVGAEQNWYLDWIKFEAK